MRLSAITTADENNGREIHKKVNNFTIKHTGHISNMHYLRGKAQGFLCVIFQVFG